jgi:hypothetical protein
VVGDETEVDSAVIAGEELAVLSSFSRPWVTNDNLDTKSLFPKACHQLEYPGRPFNSMAEACEWL